MHKVDSDMFMTDDQKSDCLLHLQTTIQSLLQDVENCGQITYYLTSIYDHTIYEALSKVVQKLLPQVPFISSMLDTLIRRSNIQKAFLFDVFSKIYIASDSGHVNMQHYEICSELIDVLIDVTCIYGVDSASGTGSKFDKKSSSFIKLGNSNPSENIVLYLREVDKCLALVCLISESEIHKQHLINYNIDMFKEGLRRIFEHSRQIQQQHQQSLKSSEKQQ